MNLRVLSYVKQRYCEDNFIRDVKEIEKITLQYTSRNTRGNAVFLVSRPGMEPKYVEIKKTDLSGLTNNKTLSIPKEHRNKPAVYQNKDLMASWVNSKTGHCLLADDIAYITADATHITVAIQPDSMLFKSSFRLIRL